MLPTHFDIRDAAIMYQASYRTWAWSRPVYHPYVDPVSQTQGCPVETHIHLGTRYWLQHATIPQNHEVCEISPPKPMVAFPKYTRVSWLLLAAERTVLLHTKLMFARVTAQKPVTDESCNDRGGCCTQKLPRVFSVTRFGKLIKQDGKLFSQDRVDRLYSKYRQNDTVRRGMIQYIISRHLRNRLCSFFPTAVRYGTVQ